MRLAWIAIPLVFSISPFAQGQPVISSPILHGATMRPSGGINREGLARGSIFVVFGSGLGPEELVHGALPYPTRLPMDPSGTHITFRNLETTELFEAYLIHSWRSQVAGIIPSAIPAGQAEVRVSYNGQESEPALVLIEEASPGFFTVSQTGQGQAVVQNYESLAKQPLNGLATPAVPGQTIVLWVTGLGPIAGPDNIAPPVGTLRDDIRVGMLGKSGFPVWVAAEYAGRSSEFPAVDQINVRIPDDGSIVPSCYVGLAIEIGETPFYSDSLMAMSETGEPCDHIWRLSADRLAALDRGERIAFLWIQIGGELGYARLARADAFGIQPFLMNGRLLLHRWPVEGIWSWPGQPSPRGVPLSDSAHKRIQLNGDMRLVGPGGRSVRFTYSEHLGSVYPAYSGIDQLWEGGEWMLQFPGGENISSFDLSLWISPLPDLTPPPTVNLAQDLTLRWDGSGYREDDAVQLQLQATRAGAVFYERLATRTALGRAGEITFTAAELAPLDLGPGTTLTWVVTSEGAPHVFASDGLDYGWINITPSRNFAARPE
jgi:uncharacterized protein (TIGR03437 family)